MSASASGNGMEDEEATGGPLVAISKKGWSALFAPSMDDMRDSHHFRKQHEIETYVGVSKMVAVSPFNP